MCASAAAFAAAPKTYYLAPDGDDQRRGTAEFPWKTLTHAARQLQPGDTLKVRAGTYDQEAVLRGCRGTAEAPITIEADGGNVLFRGGKVVGGWQPVGENRYVADIGTTPGTSAFVDDRPLLGRSNHGDFKRLDVPYEKIHAGQAVRDGSKLYVRLHDDGDPRKHEVRVVYGACVLLDACEYLVFRGIGTTKGSCGYKLQRGSSYNTICDAELSCHGQGIQENGGAAEGLGCGHNVFWRLTIHDVGLTKFDHGIYTSGTRSRILNCRFSRISGAPIHAYPAAIQLEIDGNLMTEPRPMLQVNDVIFGGGPKTYYVGMILWGMGGHRVVNNVISGDFGGGLSIRSSGNSIANNTILVKGNGIALDEPNRHTEIVNNIVRASGAFVSGHAPAMLDYNFYEGAARWTLNGLSYRTLEELRAAGHETHGQAGDPRFADPEKGDFRLRPLSPAIGAGTPAGCPVRDFAGNRRAAGGPVDVGAFTTPSARK